MKTYAYALSAMLAFQVAAMADEAAAAAPAAEAKPAAAAPAKMKSMSIKGTVVSTDAVGNTIVVKGKKADETFSVPATAKIMQGKMACALADIAAGAKVTVKYTTENGTNTASSIKVAPVAAAKTKTKTEAAPAPAAK